MARRRTAAQIAATAALVARNRGHAPAAHGRKRGRKPGPFGRYHKKEHMKHPRALHHLSHLTLAQKRALARKVGDRTYGEAWRAHILLQRNKQKHKLGKRLIRITLKLIRISKILLLTRPLNFLSLCLCV